MRDRLSVLRGFLDLGSRQVHYRRVVAANAGDARLPLLMLHGSPGSSRQLEPLMLQLRESRRVVALDTPGYGDSSRLDDASPDIAAYAAATAEALDALGFEQIDIYGAHTGAAIALDLAIACPARVRRVVLDGFGLFGAVERAAHLRHYAPAIEPDDSGAYLQTAFSFLRNLYLFWPWYEQNAAYRRSGAPPSPAAMHAMMLDMLKALPDYHLGYHASFSYAAQERLPLAVQKCLAMIQGDDPLRPHTREAANLLQHGRYQHVDRADAARAIVEFLDSSE